MIVLKRLGVKGYDYISLVPLSYVEALNRIYRDPISMGDMKTGFRYDSCEYVPNTDTDCICPYRRIEKRDKPGLLGPSHCVVNSLTGESLALHTPILKTISRFLYRVYGPARKPDSWHERHKARYIEALAQDTETKALRESQQKT